MLGTLPSISHFWSDMPTFEGRFHKLSLNPTSLTFYHPMEEFSGHYDQFHISNEVIFLVESAKFRRWFLPTKSGSNLSSILQTYGGIFRSF